MPLPNEECSHEKLRVNQIYCRAHGTDKKAAMNKCVINIILCVRVCLREKKTGELVALLPICVSVCVLVDVVKPCVKCLFNLLEINQSRSI